MARLSWRRRKTLHYRCAACGYTWDIDSRLTRMRAPRRRAFFNAQRYNRDSMAYWVRGGLDGEQPALDSALSSDAEGIAEIHECPRCRSADVENTR
jgi:hypothetical protein